MGTARHRQAKVDKVKEQERNEDTWGIPWGADFAPLAPAEARCHSQRSTSWFGQLHQRMVNMTCCSAECCFAWWINSLTGHDHMGVDSKDESSLYMGCLANKWLSLAFRSTQHWFNCRSPEEIFCCRLAAQGTINVHSRGYVAYELPCLKGSTLSDRL